MNQWWCRGARVASLICLVGCGNKPAHGPVSQGPLPPGYIAPAPTGNLPLVDHPEYVSWNRFPVGIAVIRKKEVTNETGSVSVTTTLRLAQKMPDKIVVESQVTVNRPGQPLVENPPLNLDFPAKFRLPAGMKLEQFALPSLKARPAGDETRQACGREFQTELFTWDEVNEAGPMKVKLWRSDDVPGRMVRQEIKGRTQASVEEVVEIVQPAEKLN
jgi:hypothetical protein